MLAQTDEIALYYIVFENTCDRDIITKVTKRTTIKMAGFYWEIIFNFSRTWPAD